MSLIRVNATVSATGETYALRQDRPVHRRSSRSNSKLGRAIHSMSVIGLSAVLAAACASKPTSPAMSVATAPAPTARPAPPPPPRATPAPTREATQPAILPGSLKDFQVNVGDTVYFSFDSSNLDDAARAVLQKQAAWLDRYPNVTLQVQGNCDERGTREYNIALGARRAASAREYLITLGIAPGRVDTISYGKERPVCAESTEACWAKNRRAVSAISGGRAPQRRNTLRAREQFLSA
jgi:peptidoglycan-associated lipoprotein